MKNKKLFLRKNGLSKELVQNLSENMVNNLYERLLNEEATLNVPKENLKAIENAKKQKKEFITYENEEVVTKQQISEMILNKLKK